MTVALLSGVLGASLLGSAHCAGMCGGLVVLYAGADAVPSAARWGHASYNLGRLVAYATLGVSAGIAGRVLDLGGRLAGIQSAAAIVGGLLLVLFGAHALALAVGLPAPHLRPPRVLRVAAASVASRARPRSVTTRAALLGTLSALLPCGWLWAFVATAAGTGDPLAGGVVMTVFWAGTLPALLAVGAAARALAGPLRRHLPALSAAIVLALGLLLAVGRGSIVPPAGAAGSTPSVPAEPSCHADR